MIATLPYLHHHLKWKSLIRRHISYRKGLFRDIKEVFCCLSLSSWRRQTGDDTQCFSLVQPVCSFHLQIILVQQAGIQGFIFSVNSQNYLQKHLKLLTCLWLDVVLAQCYCHVLVCRQQIQINILFMFEQLSFSSMNSPFALLCVVATENFHW